MNFFRFFSFSCWRNCLLKSSCLNLPVVNTVTKNRSTCLLKENIYYFRIFECPVFTIGVTACFMHQLLLGSYTDRQAFLGSVPKDMLAGRRYRLLSVMAFLKTEDWDHLRQIHRYWGCLVIYCVSVGAAGALSVFCTMSGCKQVYTSMKNRRVFVKKHVLRTELCPAKPKEIFAVC